MQAAFVDIGLEKSSFIHVKDLMPQVDEKIEERKDEKINNIVKAGEKILVQVQKDSNDKKGARISTHIKITGKYVILMPNTKIVTISQKIENEKERERLINIIKNNLPENTGAIIRTAGEGKKEQEIIKDLEKLQKEWMQIVEKFKKSNNKPQLIFNSPSIVEKIIIDMAEKQLEKVEVNDIEEYKAIKKLGEENFKIEISEEDLIEKYDLQKQIEKMKQRKIWLNCGGFITIDSTEALVAIDVNSGKYTGKSTLEETIYKNVDGNYSITIMRRMMYRIATLVAKDEKAKIIINGESIGQVASQTLSSMSVINEVTNMPVIRPVACMDKLEIIELSKKIGTYETSILPYEDCCTIFLPKHPVINPDLEKCLEYESKFNYQELVDECVKTREIITNLNDEKNDLL